MFGPQEGLVHRAAGDGAGAGGAVVSQPRRIGPTTASAPPIIRRSRLLPMRLLPTDCGQVAAVAATTIPSSVCFDVFSNAASQQLRLVPSLQDATTCTQQFVGTLVSDPSLARRSMRQSKRTIQTDVSAVRLEPLPAGGSGRSVHVAVEPLHGIYRMEPVLEPLGAGDGSQSGLLDGASSLRKFHVAQDTSAYRSIGHDLEGEGVWEDEDPVLAKKTAKAADERAALIDDASTVDGASGVGEQQPVKSRIMPPVPFVKQPTVPPKRDREDGLEMPPPPPVARVPADLEAKTAVVVRKYRGRTIKLEELWKEIARTVDDFRVLRTQSREAQVEWARVCKAAVLKKVQQLQCTVKDNVVTVPQ